MESSGSNFTPDKIPAAERIPLQAAYDMAMASLVTVLQPRYDVGVGKSAEAALRELGIALP